MKLTLIRHGITEGNIKKLYYGRTDLPLLDESIAFLREAGKRGGYPTASRYFTSGMLRAEQTLEALYGDIEHGVLEDLREIDFGDFEMKTYEELKNLPEYLEWISGDNESNLIPNGESGTAVTKRALLCLEPIISDGVDAVCITHGGVIGGVLGTWFPSVNGRYEYTPEPGSGFQVEFEGTTPISVKKVPFTLE